MADSSSVHRIAEKAKNHFGLDVSGVVGCARAGDER